MDRPFVKVISPEGYDFSGEPVVQLIKVSAFGLRGHDLRTFTKRAGHQFADAFKKLELKPGDVPIHLLAMGATEFYGPNRNGDGFKCAACRKYHDTFRKHARWYRNHANKDPNKSYGVVKLSSYNERMHRIELVPVLNGTQAAADRNGGLIADLELEKLASGRDIPVSMACKVPYDVCSGCGNKARHRGEYCRGVDEGGLCKAGGLRNKIATVTGDDDNPILHADNEHPSFFDISDVPRGADRIASTTGLLKAAGVQLYGGARIAEELGVTAPENLDATGVAADMLMLAHKMAAYEAQFEARGLDRHVLAFTNQTPTSWVNGEGRLGETLQALARVKVAMPLVGFLEILNKCPEKAASAAEAARPFLRGVYGRLIKSGRLAELAEVCPFLPSEPLAPLAVRRWAEVKAAEYSLDPAHVERRVFRSAVRSTPVPVVAPVLVKESGPAVEIASHYAMYKLAFARALRDQDENLDLTLKLCVAQNYA